MGATLRLKGYKVRARHTIIWTAFWMSVSRTFNIINMETVPMNKPNLYASLHSISTGVNVNVAVWLSVGSNWLVLPAVRLADLYIDWETPEFHWILGNYGLTWPVGISTACSHATDSPHAQPYRQTNCVSSGLCKGTVPESFTNRNELNKYFWEHLNFGM